MSALSPRFFVTGGTGFVGRRLVDVLRRELGAEVTVLAHRTSVGALKLAAQGVTLDFTPITNTEALAKAVAGHDAIFHLAYGRYGTASDMRRTTIDGTKAVVDAALVANVRRFVNVSTAAVYFGAPDGCVDERFPRRKWGWNYSDEKLAAEETVTQATAERGLQGSTFQVAGVYGPGGETFVVNPLRNMKRGTVVLPNQGEGIANLTYVDDVVQALILGLKDEAIGETFIIKGPGTVTRMELYLRLTKMLERDAVKGMSTQDVKEALRGQRDWRAIGRLFPEAIKALKASEGFVQTLRSTPLMPLARKLAGPSSRRARRLALPGPITGTGHHNQANLIFPPAILVDYLAARVEFSSEKAKTCLGYSPAVAFSEGMERTEQWAQWAALTSSRV